MAYEELADGPFSNFQWSLAMNACRPFGVIGTVTFDRGSGLAHGPVLSYHEMPMDLFDDALDEGDYLLSSNRRAAIQIAESREADTWLRWQAHEDSVASWAVRKNLAGPFRGLGSGSTVIDTSHDRAASSVAAHWVWNDLKRLKLTEGTFPQVKG